MNKKLHGYKGKLNPSQIAEGINAASGNAARLAKDARMLLDAGSFPSAASLAALSIEEAGKVSILRAMALARDEPELKAEWKRYRSHTSKNVQWILPELVAKGARQLDEMRPLFDNNSEHPYILDQLKQLGFYTDCLGNKANWSIPEEVIDQPLAEMLVESSEILGTKSSVSDREIYLWIEHVGPVWKQDVRWMKKALVNWYDAMQKEGLKPAGDNKMEQFV